MKTIDRFKGDYAFLNNYYEHPVTYEGITFPTNEHAFQAAKTLDLKIRRQIAECATPGEAKQKGNAVATAGCYLIEGNHWGDTCWGQVNGRGENRLGKILMQLRDEME